MRCGGWDLCHQLRGNLPNIDLAIIPSRIERVGRSGTDRPHGTVVALGILVGKLDQQAKGWSLARRGLEDAPDHDVAALQPHQQEGVVLHVGAQGHADDALSVSLGEHALPVGGIPRLDGPVQARTEDEGPLWTLEQDQVGHGRGVSDSRRRLLSSLLSRRTTLRHRIPPHRAGGGTGNEVLALPAGQIPQPDGLVGAGRPQHVAPHDDEAGDLRRVAVQRLAQREAARAAVGGLIELPRADDPAVPAGDHEVADRGEGADAPGVGVRGLPAVHVELEGRVGGIGQIPHVDHPHRRIREDLRRSLEAAEEVVGGHLQSFDLAAGHHAVLEFLGKVGGRVPEAPVSVVRSGEDLDLAGLGFPYRHRRDGRVLVLLVVAVLPVVVPVMSSSSSLLLLLVLRPAGGLQADVELDGVRELAIAAVRAVAAGGEVATRLETRLLAVITVAPSPASASAPVRSPSSAEAASAGIAPPASSAASSRATAAASAAEAGHGFQDADVVLLVMCACWCIWTRGQGSVKQRHVR